MFNFLQMLQQGAGNPAALSGMTEGLGSAGAFPGAPPPMTPPGVDGVNMLGTTDPGGQGAQTDAQAPFSLDWKKGAQSMGKSMSQMGQQQGQGQQKAPPPPAAGGAQAPRFGDPQAIAQLAGGGGPPGMGGSGGATNPFSYQDPRQKRPGGAVWG